MTKSVYRDLFGNEIRLTEERYLHIIERKELVDEQWRIGETLQHPDVVKRSNHDSEVLLYYRHYGYTPVTSKYMVVIAKVAPSDSFVLTAFFTDQIKEGETRWER